jgi:hypothetical protein
MGVNATKKMGSAAGVSASSSGSVHEARTRDMTRVVASGAQSKLRGALVHKAGSVAGPGATDVTGQLANMCIRCRCGPQVYDRLCVKCDRDTAPKVQSWIEPVETPKVWYGDPHEIHIDEEGEWVGGVLIRPKPRPRIWDRT